MSMSSVQCFYEKFQSNLRVSALDRTSLQEKKSSRLFNLKTARRRSSVERLKRVLFEKCFCWEKSVGQSMICFVERWRSAYKCCLVKQIELIIDCRLFSSMRDWWGGVRSVYAPVTFTQKCRREEEHWPVNCLPFFSSMFASARLTSIERDDGDNLFSISPRRYVSPRSKKNELNLSSHTFDEDRGDFYEQTTPKIKVKEQTSNCSMMKFHLERSSSPCEKDGNAWLKAVRWDKVERLSTKETPLIMKIDSKWKTLIFVLMRGSVRTKSNLPKSSSTEREKEFSCGRSFVRSFEGTKNDLSMSKGPMKWASLQLTPSPSSSSQIE